VVPVKEITMAALRSLRYQRALGADALTVPVFIFATKNASIATAVLQIAINRLISSYGVFAPTARLIIDGLFGDSTYGAARTMAIGAAQELEKDLGPGEQSPLAMTIRDLTNTSTKAFANRAHLAQHFNAISDSKGIARSLLEPVLIPLGQPAPQQPPLPKDDPGAPSGGMSTTTIALVAIGVGIAYALLTKKKGRKRR